MAKKYFLFILALSIWLSGTMTSCSLFTPPAIIPCYGHIDSIPLIITNPLQQGTSANGINSVWVYVDDNPIGAFQMPVTFPMIATTGQHKVTIFAGVENFGEAENRTKYPFYSSYILNTTLTQGATVKFKPTVEYATWAKVGIIDNFDESGLTPQHIYKDTNAPTYSKATDTNMYIIHIPNSNVYQGNGSGLVTVNSTKQYYNGITDTFNIPNNGSAVFLEMNYKTNNVFTVGLYNVGNSIIGGTAYYPIVYVDTSSTWKKMYINLQPTIGSYPSYNNEYKIYFNVALDPGATLGQTYFDNVKIVRYN
jgi:hypothetical protein